MYAKKNKCGFGVNEVEYLGHYISGKRVSTDPKKLEAVKQWHVPNTVKQLRGFLGLIRYYRRFVQNYGKIAQPLIVLYKWKPQMDWRTDKTFVELKRVMTTAPVLALPDFSQEFIIETNASGNGIDALLIQQCHLVAFISKELSSKH